EVGGAAERVARPRQIVERKPELPELEVHRLPVTGERCGAVERIARAKVAVLAIRACEGEVRGRRVWRALRDVAAQSQTLRRVGRREGARERLRDRGWGLGARWHVVARRLQPSVGRPLA